MVKYLQDFNEMFNYFSANKLISKGLSGFQTGDSNINQLLSITYQSFDNGLEVTSAFLDISTDFLSNRKQRLTLNGQNFSWANVHAGVS